MLISSSNCHFMCACLCSVKVPSVNQNCRAFQIRALLVDITSECVSCIAAAVSVCCLCVVLEIGMSRKGRYKWNNMQKAFGTVFSVKVSFDYLHLLQVEKGIFCFSKKNTENVRVPLSVKATQIIYNARLWLVTKGDPFSYDAE